jgi:hypothetical protein
MKDFMNFQSKGNSIYMLIMEKQLMTIISNMCVVKTLMEDNLQSQKKQKTYTFS